jgi:hypothetical protein
LYGGENAYLLEEYTSAIRSAGFSLQRTIAPFESPINLAPLSRETLAPEIAKRVPGLFGLGKLAERALRSPQILSLALKVISRFDNRPGRLYSFVAVRPA